jgi:hypothetical protein
MLIFQFFIKLSILFALVLFMNQCNGHTLSTRKTNQNILLDTSIFLDSTLKNFGSKNDQEPGTLSADFFKQMDSLYVDNDSELTIGGVVRSSGLSSVNMKELNIFSKFQLESIKKSFFLIYDGNLAQFNGKCVYIKGRYIKGWNFKTTEIKGKTTYDRTAISVSKIYLFNTSQCSTFYNLQLDENEDSKIYDTIVGTIHLMDRPAPDINYDYVLYLKTQLKIPDDPDLILSKIPLIINCEELNLKLVNSFIQHQETVTFYGNLIWGYAETKVFIINKFTLK